MADKKEVNLDEALDKAADLHFEGEEDNGTDKGNQSDDGAGAVESNDGVDDPIQDSNDNDEGASVDSAEADETDDSGVDPEQAAIEAAEKAAAAEELSDEEMAQLDQIGATPSQSLRLARLPKEARTEALAVMASKIKGDDTEVKPVGSGKIKREDVVKELKKDIPDEKLTSLSEKLNIDKDVLKELVDVVQTATLDPAADTVVRLGEAIQQQQLASQAQLVGLAVKSSRQELSRQFPAAKKDDQWKKVVTSPATAKLVSAYQEQGLDLHDAVQKALTDRCRATFSESMTAKGNSTSTAEGKGSTTKALKGTSATGGRARYPTKGKKADLSKLPLNDALDKTFEMFEDRQKATKGK